MAVQLNKKAYDYARKLIEEGKVVIDDRDAWSEDQPTADQENEVIRTRGFPEYARWFLGIDDEHSENSKGRYKFPYGGFKKVHRSGVIAAETSAGQCKHADIEKAAAHLHGMIDGLKT